MILKYMVGCVQTICKYIPILDNRLEPLGFFIFEWGNWQDKCHVVGMGDLSFITIIIQSNASEPWLSHSNTSLA